MQLPPVVVSKDTTSSSVEIEVTDDKESVNLDHKIDNKSICTVEKSKNDIPSISPLLKKYLNKKDVKNCDTRLSLTKVKVRT